WFYYRLVERFLVDSYKHQQLSTFALTLYRHRTTVKNRPVLVDFWDTAGQERFQTLHASYYHQAHAAILVFDGTRKVTYKNLATWYTELRQHRPEIPCLCAVNKIDENGGLGGKTFGFPQQHGLPLYYVSAAAGTNVVKLFEDAIKAAYEYKINPTDLSDQIMEELELHPHQDPQDQDLHQDSDGDQNVGITTDKSGGVDATDSPAS
ncbi:rab-like protein 2A, partial [Hyalella azteca]|uniref:Rab-like protein 2A n=1 Tax=Hyalella azteca TaxID=294128 RepID=A0A8B7NH18_HYAAZ